MVNYITGASAHAHKTTSKGKDVVRAQNSNERTTVKRPPTKRLKIDNNKAMVAGTKSGPATTRKQTKPTEGAREVTVAFTRTSTAFIWDDLALGKIPPCVSPTHKLTSKPIVVPHGFTNQRPFVKALFEVQVSVCVIVYIR